MSVSISPLYFPTSILFLDDEAPFLNSLPISISERFPCRLHTSPKQALAHLARHGTPPESIDNASSRTLEWFANCQRLHTVSVVIIDFEMPNMRGLEFCRQIRHLPAKRILLTGTMDKNAAVEGFNEGLFHRYLRKDSMDSMVTLERYIKELQREYMKELSRKNALRTLLQRAPWTKDDDLMKKINTFIKDQHYEEFVATPNGAYLLDRTGTAIFLVVKNNEAMDQQTQHLKNLGYSDQRILKGMERRELILHDPQQSAAPPILPLNPTTQELDDLLHPAKSILGTLDNYCIALVDAPKVFYDTPLCGLDDAIDETEPCLW